MTLVPDVTNPNQNLSLTISKQHCSPRLLTLIFPQLLTDCTMITPETVLFETHMPGNLHDALH